MIYLIIGIAGIIGALLRYGIGILLLTVFFAGFPVSTLLINLLGCFILSWFSSSAQMMTLPVWFRTGFTSGLLGAFTTFSTFSVELIQLVNKGAWTLAIIYFLASSLVGYGVSFLGHQIASNNVRREIT